MLKDVRELFREDPYPQSRTLTGLVVHASGLPSVTAYRERYSIILLLAAIKPVGCQ